MPRPRPRTPRVGNWLPLLALGLTLPLARTAAADGPMPFDVMTPPPPLVAPPPPPEDLGDCQRQFLPDGRVGAVLCMPQNEPMRMGRHRLEQFTGTLLTYHQSGAVQEVLTLRDGYLDGMFELYDENGHLVERGLFEHGVRKDLGVTKMPVVAWPPPAYVAIGDARGEKRMPIDRIGFNPLDGSGTAIGISLINGISRNAYTTFDQMGLSLAFALRMERLWAEFHLEYLQSVTNVTDYKRIDVPFFLSLRYFLGTARVRPFIASGLGMNYAWRRIPGDISAQPSESAWMANFHGALGFAGPLGKKAAWMTELRIGVVARTDTSDALHTVDSQGNSTIIMGTQFLGQLGVGITWLP